MKLQGNTVFITGGSSGIGLELSNVLSKNGNKVIICGRSKEKLSLAQNNIPDLVTYQCDLSDKNECDALIEKIKIEHPDLNVLINNAAIVNKIDFLNNKNSIELAEIEYRTNLFAPMQLIKGLSDTLKVNHNARIINITTGLIYAPRVIYPFYNSSKSALHSFTLVLRESLKKDNIEVNEVMFPAVDTPWHNGNPPKIAISTESAVNEMINGLKKNKRRLELQVQKNYI
jgi:uncharacterized oxidoreductase